MLIRRILAVCAVLCVVIGLGVFVNKGSGGESPPVENASAGFDMAALAGPDDAEDHEHTCPTAGVEVAGVWTCDTGNGNDAVLVSQWPFDATPDAAQREAAKQFVTDSVAGAGAYADYNVARADGYTFDTLDETVKSVLGSPLVSQSLDGVEGGVVTHLVSPARTNDGIALDPTKPDALVYATDGEQYTLIGVMFMVPGESKAPQPGGPLTTWHYHKNPSCLDGAAPVAFRQYLPGDSLYAGTGPCPSGTLAAQTGLMLHVWLDPQDLPSAFLTWGDGYIERALQPGQGAIRQSDGPQEIAGRTRG